MKGYKLCRLIKVTGLSWKDRKCIPGNYETKYAWSQTTRLSFGVICPVVGKSLR